MIWTEVELTMVGAGQAQPARVRFAVDSTCFVEVLFESGKSFSGGGSDLFDALSAVRRIIEPSGFLVACNGARRNVFPSPMLRQATAGRRAYVLEIPRTSNRPPVVDIFEPAEGLEVCTVDEQLNWHSQWLASGEI
ncbi:hypothetical protein ACFVXQ_02980 [Kitasatospora sp. NPDC058263]